MRRILVTIAVILFFGPTIRAQNDLAGTISCWEQGSLQPRNRAYTKKLWDGYEIGPEVVFITDTGGGMHCCWAYNVISLTPKPHKLFDIEKACASRESRNI